MNLYHLGCCAQIVNNLLAHIAVRIVLGQACGVVPVVFRLTESFHSIVLICGMDASLNGRNF